MKEELFQELLESVREGGAILRGETPAARAFSVSDPDVAELREAYGLSQSKFAGLLGISVRTLQNWEQRRRSPEGPARVLLRVAARHPEAVLDVVHEDSKGKNLRTKRRRASGKGGVPRTRVAAASAQGRAASERKQFQRKSAEESPHPSRKSAK